MKVYLLLFVLLLVSCGKEDEKSDSSSTALTTSSASLSTFDSLKSAAPACRTGSRIDIHMKGDDLASGSSVGGQFQANWEMLDRPLSGNVEHYYYGLSTSNDLMVAIKTSSSSSYSVSLSMCPYSDKLVAGQTYTSFKAPSGIVLPEGDDESGALYAIDTSICIDSSTDYWFGPTTFYPAVKGTDGKIAIVPEALEPASDDTTDDGSPVDSSGTIVNSSTATGGIRVPTDVIPPLVIVTEPTPTATPTATTAAKPTWWCVRGDNQPCTVVERYNPILYRQIIVLPTGFTEGEYDKFRTEFDQIIAAQQTTGPNVYANKYKNKILYIGYWLPGGPLSSATSIFNGREAPHPIRPKALAMDETAAFDKVADIAKKELKWLSPWSILVHFNSDGEGVTANAAPPSSIRRPYGIAKVHRGGLSGNYLVAHEVGHSALNYVDEYIESGFENMSIKYVDYATPLALANGTWDNFVLSMKSLLTIYDLKISDILAANGNENTDVSRYASRVLTAGHDSDEFSNEGGMFFGKDVFHHIGKNIMGDHGIAAANDGYASDHSEPQLAVVKQVFETPFVAARPNDRLSNAGPMDGWPLEFGGTTSIMVFDADKNHHYHPTTSYDVQIGWYERDWKTCWAGGVVPYPCYDDVWRVWEKNIPKELRTIDLLASKLFGLADVVQKAVCGLGINEIPTSSGATFKLCETDLATMATTFIPSVVFSLPYQEVDVPCDQWMTTYYWRFRTNNRSWTSGWTGWSEFTRTL